MPFSRKKRYSPAKHKQVVTSNLYQYPGIFPSLAKIFGMERSFLSLTTILKNGVKQLLEKRYHDGKISLLVLGITLPIQILAWSWLAYQYFWTGEVIFTLSANGQMQKYGSYLFFSPALVFLWPFALWYFPYLSGGGKLAMTLFSLAVYRMTAWCTQILYRWYAWQEQLQQLQSQAANQIGYINNIIADWSGLVYIKFKETGPIIQHNAEYLIQQQLNKFGVGNIAVFAQKYGAAAANHFQEKLEEMKILSIQLLTNRQPSDLDPAKSISDFLEKKIRAELPLVEDLPALNTTWWQKGWEKIQGIDWSHPHVKTVGWAVGGLILLGVSYWGVQSMVTYFFGPDKRIDNLAGVATNHEKDVAEIVSYLQRATEAQQKDLASLLQSLQDNQQLSDETAAQLLSLKTTWFQPNVQSLIACSEDLVNLVEVVDPGSFGLLAAGVQELKVVVEKLATMQENDKETLDKLTDHFYRLCNKLNIQILAELRPRR